MGDGSKQFSPGNWADVVKKIGTKLNNVPVDKALLTKDGKGCIIIPNKEAQGKANQALVNDPDFSVTVASHPRRNVLPKIKVTNVDTDVYSSKELLKKAILDKNDCIQTLLNTDGESLEVVFIDTARKFAILKVSPDIRSLIIKQGKVYVDMCSLPAFDHFLPLQCYSCQKFGHTVGSIHCPNKSTGASICLYCAGSHTSKSCTVKRDPSRHNCINCLNSANHI